MSYYGTLSLCPKSESSLHETIDDDDGEIMDDDNPEIIDCGELTDLDDHLYSDENPLPVFVPSVKDLPRLGDKQCRYIIDDRRYGGGWRWSVQYQTYINRIPGEIDWVPIDKWLEVYRNPPVRKPKSKPVSDLETIYVATKEDLPRYGDCKRRYWINDPKYGGYWMWREESQTYLRYSVEQDSWVDIETISPKSKTDSLSETIKRVYSIDTNDAAVRKIKMTLGSIPHPPLPPAPPPGRLINESTGKDRSFAWFDIDRLPLYRGQRYYIPVNGAFWLDGLSLTYKHGGTVEILKHGEDYIGILYSVKLSKRGVFSDKPVYGGILLDSQFTEGHMDIVYDPVVEEYSPYLQTRVVEIIQSGTYDINPKITLWDQIEELATSPKSDSSQTSLPPPLKVPKPPPSANIQSKVSVPLVLTPNQMLSIVAVILFIIDYIVYGDRTTAYLCMGYKLLQSYIPYLPLPP